MSAPAAEDMNHHNADQSIEFFFDPMCPWAFQTSLWIREVRKHLGLNIRWSFFSLEEVNREEDKKHPWEREWSYGWSQMRVGALLRREGMGNLDRWYEAVGSAFHLNGRRTHDPEIHRQLLTELGHDPKLLDEALNDSTTSDEVQADHERAVSHYGGYGVPIVVLPGDHALFGPVITPAPTGDKAVRLWELVSGWNEFPHLYELTHPKTEEDHRHIGKSFDTYLKSRAWRTIQNPAP